VQHDGRAIGLGKREHFFGHDAMELDALNEICWRCYLSLATVLVRGLTRIPTRIASPTSEDEGPNDASKPRLERATFIGPLLSRDDPRLLREVVGFVVVTNERTSESPHPAHLDHQLLAGWLHPHINCRRCANRLPKRLAIAKAQAYRHAASRPTLAPASGPEPNPGDQADLDASWRSFPTDPAEPMIDSAPPQDASGCRGRK
jgi:hypothetical protein